VISAVDHVVLLAPEIEAGVAVYSALLGRTPDWRARTDEGVATAVFQLGNTALELVAPSGDGISADHLRARITEEGPGLKSLAFRSTDLAGDHRIFTRLALSPTPVEDGESEDMARELRRTWRRFRTPPEAGAGVRWFFIEPLDGILEPAEVPLGHVHALDHLVINTPNPDRAMALYGAKLGLRLALDRTAPEWGVRLIFFRTGGLTVEIAHRLGQAEDPSGPDSIWGLTWRVGDIEAAHDRLTRSGFNVSEVRSGRRPGTRVFTVRDGTMGVPTLFISGVAD
jgi:catechol 2,3-dioxygenase-like lactoylglutathione lyase family enzyme